MIYGVAESIFGTGPVKAFDDTVNSIFDGAGRVAQVFIDKAPKSMEFLYYNMKFVGDCVRPTADYLGSALFSEGSVGDLFVKASKGQLKFFASVASIGSSYQGSLGKVESFWKAYDVSSFVSAAGSVCGTLNKTHDICSTCGSVLKMEGLGNIANVFARVHFSAMAVGATFRGITASETLYADVKGEDGFFGSKPVPQADRYKFIVSGSLSVISNVALAVLGVTLLLKDFALISAALSTQIIIPITLAGTAAKVVKYYYDDINGVGKRPPPGPVDTGKV